MDTGVSALEMCRMHIGGEWIDAASGETFESDNAEAPNPFILR